MYAFSDVNCDTRPGFLRSLLILFIEISISSGGSRNFRIIDVCLDCFNAPLHIPYVLVGVEKKTHTHTNQNGGINMSRKEVLICKIERLA